MTEPLPLDGLLVLDFSQFLAGPTAALRLADLGARVIKIERSGSGEAGRSLGLAGMECDGDSLLFHTINRNKESLAVDLRVPEELRRIRNLVGRADVMIQGFRPGVMERYGLDFENSRVLNEGLVYASVSGYGPEGPWRDRPGQDLLVQALTGLPWMNGNAGDPPLAFGLSIVDTHAGEHLCEGILACLIRRGVTGHGGLVEVSLLESALDLQFEGFTAFLNNRSQLPSRSAIAGAHPYLGAPYGIYQTADGFIALAMGSIPAFGEVLGIEELRSLDDPHIWFERRDEIKTLVAAATAERSTYELVDAIDDAGLWAAPVLSWPELVEHEGFRAVDAVIEVGTGARSFRTTRCPIRIDGASLRATGGAPRLGEHGRLPGESEADPGTVSAADASGAPK